LDIVIVGKGVVGQATAKILKGSVFHDPAKGSVVPNFEKYHYAVVCVPTPGDSNGLNHSAVEESIKELKEKNFKGVLVIRSTCSPEFLSNIDYPKLVYWPEFLRERTAELDALNPHIVVLGGLSYLTEEWTGVLEKFKHSCIKWFATDLTSAAVAKLGLNSALAAKVAMFNTIYQVCEDEGADWKVVRAAIAADWRIGIGQTDVPGPDGSLGFGGKCLPKDVDALAKLAKNNLYIESITRYNNTLRKEN
jgi:UDPglucose 6-dehydrogenase